MPLTRSAIHRLHLEQSASPAPDTLPVAAPPPLDESISSTLVSDDRTPDSASASSSSSDTSSDSSDSSDDSDDDDDDTADSDVDPTAHLSALLARAKAAARTRDHQLQAAHDKRRGTAGDGLAGNDELVLFGDDADEDSASDDGEQRRDRDARCVVLSLLILLPLKAL